ncbi:MAG: hypothetical protein QME60_00965 [Verrucomicrobiota bacterium]|nr:hypothetical protein [Verrucomicrobiota bacterium]
MNEIFKLAIMLVVTLLTVGVTFFTLRSFFRRLRRLEEERWGKTPWKGDR